MGQPTVSFLMSVYNGEAFLAGTLDSIMAQTYKNWECVVIDDCSTDRTPDILARYARADGRIRVYRNGRNLRLARSLNRGLELARGTYIARIDADDMCFPARLERQVAFMEENPEVAVSCCRYFTLNNGVVTPAVSTRRTGPEDVKGLFLFFNPILHPGVIARAPEMKAFGYDPAFTCTEDLELWTRLLAQGRKLAIQDEYLVCYRLHDRQITATTDQKQREEYRVIARRFYQKLLFPLTAEELELLTTGIYFRDQVDMGRFSALLKKIRQANARQKSFTRESVNYAALEVLAAYKRAGVTKKELLCSLARFDPIFLIREWRRRKSSMRRAGLHSARQAEALGLVPIPADQRNAVTAYCLGRAEDIPLEYRREGASDGTVDRSR